MYNHRNREVCVIYGGKEELYLHNTYGYMLFFFYIAEASYVRFLMGLRR